MEFNKKFFLNRLKGIETSLKIAQNVKTEFTQESDWVRAWNQDCVIARLEGKKELLEEFIRALEEKP